MLQGLVHFPGIKHVQGAQMTLTPGVVPSACVITLLPQTDFAPRPGTLTFTYGRTTIRFHECLVDAGSLERREQSWSLRVLDRRWKWRFGSISGRYNQRRADGQLDPSTQAKPRELARKLFEALGEPRPSPEQLAGLPDDARPTVDWQNANPAQALAALCEMFACRIVLGLDDRVWIRGLGRGRQLPDIASAMQRETGSLGPPRPGELQLACGPTLYQSKFRLEAVGEDVDGIVRPIDELSYKPAAGWRGQSPAEFSDVTKVYQRELAGRGVRVPLVEEESLAGAPPAVLEKYAQCRDLAMKTVWRWFRIRELAEGGLTPQGHRGAKVNSRRQLLPFRDSLLDTFVDAQGNSHARAAYCEGTFALSLLGDNSLPHTVCPGEFSLDADEGLVMFHEPIAKYAGDSAALDHDSPELYLTASHFVRDDAGSLSRHVVLRPLPGPKSLAPLAIACQELQRTSKSLYTGAVPSGVVTNDKELARQAERYLDAAQREYAVEPSSGVQYAGLVAIEPDGAIEHVFWSVGGGQAAITRATRRLAT